MRLNNPGRESWVWAEQRTLYKKEFPPRVGGGNFRRNGNAEARAERVGAPIGLLLLLNTLFSLYILLLGLTV